MTCLQYTGPRASTTGEPMSDVRTLRLASIQLTAELLARFQRYQRVMVSELNHHKPDEWAGLFAFAHAKALTESKLDSLSQQQLRAMVSDFCGRRSAALTVKQRIAEGEHQRAEGKADSKTEAMLQRARVELPKLEDLAEFTVRYGEGAVALLRGAELELVTLHRDLARLEGGPGHVHN